MLYVEELLLEANQRLLVGDEHLSGLDRRHRQDVDLGTTQQQPEGEGLDGRKDQHYQHGVPRTEVQRSQAGVAQGADDSCTPSTGRPGGYHIPKDSEL